MGLNWNFNERIGYVNVTDPFGGKSQWRIYQGNAYAIFTHENDEDHTYSLANFWADETHAKRCLGLVKGYDNLLCNDGYEYEFFLDGNYDHSFAIAKLLKKAKLHFTLEY